MVTVCASFPVCQGEHIQRDNQGSSARPAVGDVTDEKGHRHAELTVLQSAWIITHTFHRCDPAYLDNTLQLNKQGQLTVTYI